MTLDKELRHSLDKAASEIVTNSLVSDFTNSKNIESESVKADNLSNLSAPVDTERTEADTGTWFQAPPDQQMSVLIQARIDGSPSSVRLILDVNDVQNANNSDQIDENDPVDLDVHKLVGTVPAGGFYRVRDIDGGGFTISRWKEQT